ncbi:rab-GTPase-TBC domain-containing protein [Cantharellus anzutake]|uniref:rab-GTPase-TBC domain-containing protein n=1 Tax=Cantharellus anzutake TaxID=1750568 RepID=UPI001903FE47|nr:rab-GTPase-TBC domain-containing protein [Cantharellus anzutake]KAF8334135.1 rab-GTPase-TBC domain-containing protein [Cantharellus anzutake]
MTLRASPHDIRNSFERLFDNRTSLDKIRDAALSGELLSNPENAYDPSLNGMLPGRSLAWKLFLLPAAPLTDSLSPIPSPPLDALRSARSRYASLIRIELRAPDGSYEEWVDLPGADAAVPDRNTIENWTRNNPLSLDADSGWNDWFDAVELRKVIRQDVERTFPDIEYFRDPHIQSLLTSILYVYSIQDKNVGYRQGMHELLAPLLYAIDFDSLKCSVSQPEENEVLAEFCDRTWIAADAHALFSIIMNGIGAWYEWREPTHKQPISQTIPGSFEPISMKPWVAPIVEACRAIHSDYLQHSDPALWSALQNSQIEPQIFGIRWLRLLFTREFGVGDSMVLWDGLFASDPTLQLSKWICVAMLIRIRNHLITSDYSTQLGYLLRYPSVTPAEPISHISLLLQQAQALKADPNPATAVSLVMQNKTALGIPAESPGSPAPLRRAKSRESPEDTRNAHGHPPSGSSTSGAETRKDPFGLPLPIPELFSKGLSDINGAVYNTVSEIRRNLPEFAQHIRHPSSPDPSIPFSYQSLMTSKTRPSLERDGTEGMDKPPWEPRTRFEIEREVAAYSSMNKRLGKALSWVVDTLLQGAEDTPDPLSENSAESAKRREALECLAYTRDLLNADQATPASQLDEERLLGETEYHSLREERAKAGQYNSLSGKNSEGSTSAQEPLGRRAALTFPARAAQGVVLDSASKPVSRQVLASYQSNRNSTPTATLTRTPLISPPPSTNAFRNISTSIHKPDRSLASHFDGKPKETVAVSSASITPPWISTLSNFDAGRVAHGVRQTLLNPRVSGSEILQRPAPSLSFYGSESPDLRGITNKDDTQGSSGNGNASSNSPTYQSDPLRG